MIDTGLLLRSLDDAEAHLARLHELMPASSVLPRHVEPALTALEAGVDRFVAEGSRHDGLVAGRLLSLAQAIGAQSEAQLVAPAHRARVAEGRIHAFRLDWEAADRAIGDLVFRPHATCGDVAGVRSAMLVDRAVRPNLLASQTALARLFLERLLFLLARFEGTQDRLDIVEAFGPQLAILVGDAATRAHVAAASRVSDALLGAVPPALAYLRVRRPWPNRPANPRQLVFRLRGGQPFRALLAALVAEAQGRRNFALGRATLEYGDAPQRVARTLATYAGDDPGDVLLMVPGLLARARRDGEPVHCAVPRRLLPLLAGLPHVVPLETESDLPFAAYHEWIDLAGRRDAARASVETFATALGATAGECDAAGGGHRLELDAGQRALRDAVRDAARASGRPVVGVAPSGPDPARDAPVLAEVAERLAGTCVRLVLHEQRAEPLDGAAMPGLTGLMAGIAACDYVIATDGAALHIAAALGVPALAVLGPTDGRLGSGPTPGIRVMQPRFDCPVMPCWRTEAQPCGVSLGPSSTCLAALRAEDVLAEFDALVAAHPIAGSKRRRPRVPA